jgi:NitT/TauT family transport system substrate-binding protein
MKLRLISAAIALAIAFVTALAPTKAEPVKIRLGYFVIPGIISPLLFKKTDIMKHYGKSYTVENVFIRGSSLALQALAAKEVDISFTSFSAFTNAIINGGLDIKIISDLAAWSSKGHQGPVYVVRGDSDIKTIKDLKGKVLAVPARGTGFHFALLANLKKIGYVENKDFNVVEVRVPGMGPALKAKKVDLATAVPPFLYLMEKKDKVRRLFRPEDGMGDVQSLLNIGRTEFLNANKAAVADFMEDYIIALKWFLDPKNHDEASEITAKFTKRPVRIYKSFAFTKKDFYRDPSATPNMAALQRNIDTLLDLGVIKKRVVAAKHTDFSYLNEAKKRLGIK